MGDRAPLQPPCSRPPPNRWRLPIVGERLREFHQHVQINAEPLDVVFDGGQSEIDEVNLFPLNEDVVAG